MRSLLLSPLPLVALICDHPDKEQAMAKQVKNGVTVVEVLGIHNLELKWFGDFVLG